MQLQFRHGIVRHQIDIAGTANFIRKSGSGGDYIDLVCDNSPLLFTVAHASANYLIEISKTVTSAWGPVLPTGQTQYLFWDISLLDASLSFGHTLLPPFISAVAPNSPSLDQHWFDTRTVMMKVWNGTKWLPKLRVFAGVYDNSAILTPKPVGTQVTLNTPCVAGNILMFDAATPLRGGDGTFLNSESTMIASYTSGQPLKLEAAQLYAEAVEFIPKFSLVRFTAPKKVALASANDAGGMVNGIMLDDYFPGEVGNVVDSGLVRNSEWSFNVADINKVLYVGGAGGFSTVAATTPTYKIGYIYDVDAIIVQLQQVTADAVGTSYSAGAGIDIASNGAISILDSGVTPGTYNAGPSTVTPFTVDATGRVTQTNSPVPITMPWTAVTTTPTTLFGYGITDAQPLNGDLSSIAGLAGPSGILTKLSANTWALDPNTYLTANENITISGDITGSGTTSIPVSLAMTGVIAGTYSNVTVDSKGRVLAGTNPTTLGGYGIVDAYTIMQIDGFLSQKAALVHTHPLDLTVDAISPIAASLVGTTLAISLQTSGVTPGSYNNVAVDSYGRITSASTVAYLTGNQSVVLSGDVTGFGTTAITTTLSDTGVTPGTYNSFTVDSKGRITGASVESNTSTTDLSGDVVGSGAGSIITSLSTTGVTAGTYNSVTVDAKGRVIAGSVVSTSFATTLTGDISGTGTGTIATTLADTGIAPGTYNSITFDSKGRATAGTVESFSSSVTLTGDVTGTGSGTFATTLSDTGVTPGTYNSFTVDSKGRITAATSTTDVDIDHLTGLLDVSASTAIAGQTIVYDGTSMWNSGYTDQIAFSNSKVQVSVDIFANESVKTTINNKELIATGEFDTTIGYVTDRYWLALLGESTSELSGSQFVSHGECVDSEGSIFIYGHVNTANTNGVSTPRGFLAKFADDGQLIWQTSFVHTTDTSSNNWLSPIVAKVTPENHLAIAVEFNAPGFPQGNMMKIDGTNGEIIWKVAMPQYFKTTDMAMFADGASAIVGYDHSTPTHVGYILSFSDLNGTMENSISIDNFDPTSIVVTDAPREYFIAGSRDDGGLGIKVASFLHVDYFTGNILHEVSLNLNNQTFTDLDVIGNNVYLVSVNPNGSIAGASGQVLRYNMSSGTWMAAKGISSATYGMQLFGIDADDANNVYVSGHIKPSDGSSFRLYLAHLDPFLNPVWERSFYSSNGAQETSQVYAEGFNIVQLFNQSVYFTGTTGDFYSKFAVIGKYPLDGSVTDISNPPFDISTEAFTFNNSSLSLVAEVYAPLMYPAVTLNTPFVTPFAGSAVPQMTLIDTLFPYVVNLASQLQARNGVGNFGQVLTSGGFNEVPSWQKVPLPQGGPLISVSSLGTTSKISLANTIAQMAQHNVIIGTNYPRSLSGVNNTTLGIDSLDGILSSPAGNVSNSTALGAYALSTSSQCNYATAVGIYCGQNFVGDYNTSVGTSALQNGSGFWNIAIGDNAMNGGVNSDYNIAIGQNTLTQASGASNNVAIGSQALAINTSGSNNVALGYQALANNTSFTNVVGLGMGTNVTGNNQVQLGNSFTTTYVYGTVQNRSDIRDKADVRDTVLGLDFISALRPVDFKWNYREDYKVVGADGTVSELPNDGSKTRSRYHHGLIAQELKAVLDNKGVDFGGYQDHNIGGGLDRLTIGYEELIGPLIKAVQELKAQNAELAARIQVLESK